MHAIVQTGCVHTQVVLLVLHVHMHAALPTSHVPVDRLIYVKDCCLISVGVEDVS
jgi:hypothetical protein